MMFGEIMSLPLLYYICLEAVENLGYTIQKAIRLISTVKMIFAFFLFLFEMHAMTIRIAHCFIRGEKDTESIAQNYENDFFYFSCHVVPTCTTHYYNGLHSSLTFLCR